MVKKSSLDDPRTAAYAWSRFRRILRWLGLLALTVVLVAIAAVYWSGAPVTIHFYIAMALGLGLTVMLTGALMGLVFLSSGTGHDETIEDQVNKPRPPSRWRD